VAAPFPPPSDPGPRSTKSVFPSRRLRLSVRTEPYGPRQYAFEFELVPEVSPNTRFVAPRSYERLRFSHGNAWPQSGANFAQSLFDSFRLDDRWVIVLFRRTPGRQALRAREGQGVPSE
jgi:hypothetical protein